jgi:uncharacterized protein
MLIKVQDLELQKLEFDQQWQPGAIDLGAEVHQKDVLLARGRAELIEETRERHVVKDIRVVGELAARIEFRCDRCLEPLSTELKSSFDLIYRPQGVDARGDEVKITEAETEIGYYQGEGVMLEDVLREQMLLSIPMKRLCVEACKGLCPHCGRNLNLGACDCRTTTADPRWAALGELRDKLKN